MRNLNRISPFFVCILFILPILVSYSIAFAAEEVQPPPVVEDGDIGEDDDAPVSTGMFDTTESLGKTFMDGIWSLFGLYVPGFSFTFGQMWLGVLLASVSIWVIRILFGFGGSGSDGVSSRTSSTSSPKISKERRHDEF